MRTAAVLRGLALALLACPAACGGSSGGGSPEGSDALFSGSYHYLLVGGQAGPPPATLGHWGVSAADGAGVVSVTSFSQNVDDVVSVGAPFELPYAVDASRRLTFSDALGPFARGGISPEGDVVATATARPGYMPALLLCLRRSGTFSNASLAGTYHYLAHIPFAGATILHWGTIAFDGTGGYVRDIQSILAGVPNGSLVSPGTYATAADGTLVLDGETQGGILEGGDVAVLTAPVVTPVSPPGGVSLVVLVRRSASATLSSLSGSYSLVGRMVEHPQGGPHSVQTGTASVTAPGVLSASFVGNEEGVIGPPQAGALSFTVAPDGGMALLGDDVHVGAVSRDGRLAVVLGGITYGSDAQIVLLVR